MFGIEPIAMTGAADKHIAFQRTSKNEKMLQKRDHTDSGEQSIVLTVISLYRTL